jgi:hypothetical protein
VISLAGDNTRPEPGDLIEVGSLLLTLGSERDCRFVTTPPEDGRLLLKTADGGTRVVAVNVWSETSGPWNDPRKTFHDPLGQLTPSEISGLWGIQLADWPEGTERRLSHVDQRRTCVWLTEHALSPSGKSLPPLPKGLRYLRLADGCVRVKIEQMSLSPFDHLVFLDVGGMLDATLDATDLRCANSLRGLRIGSALTNAAALGNLHELRVLDLSWGMIGDSPFLANLSRLRILKIPVCGVTDISFVKNLKELEALWLDMNPVTDLSPLDGLRRLREVRADGSSAQVLPLVPMPRLRELRVLSTRLSDERVAEFRRLNPNCVVSRRWRDALEARIRDADRMDILEWTAGNSGYLSQKRVLSISSKDVTRDFLATIEIDEKDGLSFCGCIGGPIFKFCRGGQCLVEMTLHHGQSLRWEAGWPGDAELTTNSQVEIAQWLQQAGYPAVEEARLHEIKEAEAASEREQAFWAMYPPAVHDAFLSLTAETDDPRKASAATANLNAAEDELARTISRLVADPIQVVVAFCRAWGTREQPWFWNGFAFEERAALAAAQAVADAPFAKAIATVDGDISAMQGAALLLFNEDCWKKLPATERSRWCVRLGELVLTGLGTSEKMTVLHTLSDVGTPETLDLLRRVAAGVAGTEAPWPRNFDVYADEPGTRAAACLLLAMRRDTATERLVEGYVPASTNRPDTMALELARAFLGKGPRIRKEHFEVKATLISWAACRVAEEHPTRENVDVLIEHGISQGYYAASRCALKAVARIAGFNWYKEGQEVRKEHYAMAREWWQKNRERFPSAKP